MHGLAPLEIKVFKSERDWVETITQVLATALYVAIAQRGVGALAVPGGRTAKAVLPALSNQELPWDVIDVFVCDERWVPLAHEASNVGLVRRLMPQARVTGLLLADSQSLASETLPDAADVEALTKRLPERFDAVLLGMGEDGHIASLFPGSPHKGGPLVVTQRPDFLRLSLPPHLLSASPCLVLAFAGAEKWSVFDISRQRNDPKAYPVCYLFQQPELQPSRPLQVFYLSA